MAISKDVEVKIISMHTHRPLAEYNKPGVLATSSEIERYIESESDTGFRIVVTLKKGFHYQGADGVSVLIRIDGGTVKIRRNYEKAFALPYEYRKLRIIHSDVSYAISDAMVKRDNEWLSTFFRFGAVSVVEDLLVDNDILDKQLAKLGRIDVSICRSYISKPRGNHSRKSDRLNKETRHIHKRLLTQSLSHTFKAGTEWKRLQPGYTKKTRAIPIDGRHGQPIKFRFLYRSSAVLESLGCVPASPPPAPSSEQTPIEMMMNHNEFREARLLREIAFLRNGSAARRTGVRAQRTAIQQLMQSSRALFHELANVGDLDMQLAALPAARANPVEVASAVPASTATMTEQAANIFETEHINQEPDEEGGRPSRCEQHPEPEYINLDD